jgi:putative endonuclease
VVSGKGTRTNTASSSPRRNLGQAGEQMAVGALEAAGFTVVTRNWRCSAGEIDIVAEELAPDYAHGGLAAVWKVLVEVRTRRGDAYGTALQSIGPAKQAKLRQVAKQYVQATGWAGPWRIDVVAVQMDGEGRLQAIEHIRGAVADA